MPSELIHKLSSHDFTWLKAYAIIEPFGAKRDNFHTGLLASLYANAHLKKGATPTTPSDFFYTDPHTMRENQLKQQQQSGLNFAAFLDQKVTNV